MILKNKVGREKEFHLILEVVRNDSIYAIYKDPLTDNLYSGKYNDNKLVTLNDDEYEYLNKIIDKINS